jgi:hypothetical protein
MSIELQWILMDRSRMAPGACIVADSAFPVAAQLEGRIRTPLKDRDIEKFHPSLHAGLTIVSNAVTSLRQAAEWGMGCVPKVYRLLQLPLPFNQAIRGRRLSNMFRLYNYRVRKTGISQIKNYFGA